MGGRHLLWVTMVASVCAGCGGVFERPGHDFSVRVLDESPITVVGQISAPVRFAVDGCEAFDLALEDVKSARHPLPFTSRTDGSFEVSVPIAWMRYTAGALDDQGCLTEARYPSPQPLGAALVVTCRDAGRVAKGEFSMSVATATRIPQWGGYTVRAVFPSDDPLAPWLVQANRADGGVALPPRLWTGDVALDWGAAELNPLVRPRLARNGDRVFVTLGCEPDAACPQPTERLADVSFTDAPDAPPRGIAHVPSAVIDIAYAQDGALVVLSQTGDIGQWSSGNTSTIVTRVEPAPEGSQGTVENAVTLVAELPRHAPLGRFARTAAGELRFLTRTYPEAPGTLDAVLHATDGHTVGEVMTAGVLGELKADGPHFYYYAFLSPDGSSMLVANGMGKQLVSTDPAHPAREWLESCCGISGAVWLPGAVALWHTAVMIDNTGAHAGGTVRVYDDTAPHALRWEYEVEALPGATALPLLLGVSAVGDKLALTTSTGLRILGPDGTLVGGSDPFPCGLTTTAVAVPTGPTTVGVGAGTLLYVFDVGP